jgi:hypothetical protein
MPDNDRHEGFGRLTARFQPDFKPSIGKRKKTGPPLPGNTTAG